MKHDPIRVVIAEVVTTPYDKALIDQRIDELQQLVSTYGGLTVVEVVQQRAKPDYKTYLGSGKIEETVDLMKRIGAEILILGNILKPQQIYNVSERLRKDGLQARDRVDLILKIFERHAKSTEARLQIEMASIKHM